MARAADPHAAHSQDGVSSRGESTSAKAAGPLAATLRRTAFTRPANGARPRVLARATAAAPAACPTLLQGTSALPGPRSAGRRRIHVSHWPSDAQDRPANAKILEAGLPHRD